MGSEQVIRVTVRARIKSINLRLPIADMHDIADRVNGTKYMDRDQH